MMLFLSHDEMMKHFLMMIVAVMLALPAMGQANRIYIEGFEVEPDSTITVPVMMTNADTTRGLQFNVSLPEGLALDNCVVSAHSKRYEMTMSCQYDKAHNYYLVLVYPMGRVSLPAGDADVVQLTLTAKSDFKGGDIVIWKCVGSTVENTAIAFDGDTTTVTVPENALFGVPIDQKPVKDQFFQPDVKP